MKYFFTEWDAMIQAVQTDQGRREFIEKLQEAVMTEIKEGYKTRHIVYTLPTDFLEVIKLREYFIDLQNLLSLFDNSESFRKLVYLLDQKIYEDFFLLTKKEYTQCLHCGFKKYDQVLEECPRCHEGAGASSHYLGIRDRIMRERRGDQETLPTTPRQTKMPEANKRLMEGWNVWFVGGILGGVIDALQHLQTNLNLGNSDLAKQQLANLTEALKQFALREVVTLLSEPFEIDPNQEEEFANFIYAFRNLDRKHQLEGLRVISLADKDESEEIMLGIE